MVLGRELEELGLGAARVELARAGLHRRAPGVGLQASAAPAGAVAPVLHDHRVADLAGAAATMPRLAVEDQAAADTGAPEDAEQRAVGPAGAEHELGVGRHADVVAQRDLRAERRMQRRGEREARVPAGQVVGARDGARRSVDRARRADTDTAQLRGLERGGLRRLGERRGHRVRNVRRAAGGRRGMARTAEHLVGGIGDDRLDLGAAEVDAADGDGGGSGLRGGRHRFQVTSRRMVTGPSFVSSTSMCSPKRPRAASSRSQNRE